MPDFHLHLLRGNEVVETAVEPLGSHAEAAAFAHRIAEGLKSNGWIGDDEYVELSVSDEKGLELFRLTVF